MGIASAAVDLLEASETGEDARSEASEARSEVDLVDPSIARSVATLAGLEASEARSEATLSKIKTVCLKPMEEDTALEAGSPIMKWTVPAELDGYDLVTVGAHVYAVSKSEAVAIQIKNYTTPTDMLSTKLTIDQDEKDSKDAAAAAVIDTASDAVATGDEIGIDLDSIGSAATGLEVRFGFKQP